MARDRGDASRRKCISRKPSLPLVSSTHSSAMISRTTFMESLNTPDRELLLRFAANDDTAAMNNSEPKAKQSDIDLVQKELNDHEFELFGDEMEPPAKHVAQACVVAPSQYMKTIWELRHRLQASSAHTKSLSEKLKASEEARQLSDTKALHADILHKQQVSQLAAQLESFITADSVAAKKLKSASAAKDRAESELSNYKKSENRLRDLLAAEIALRSHDQTHWEAPAAWQKLSTESLLRASEPPIDFPTPHVLPFTAASFQRLTIELKRVQDEMNDWRSRCENQHEKNDEMVLTHNQKTREMKRKHSVMNSHLSGAVRRIQWLLQERKKLLGKMKKADKYATRLELTLLRHHEEHKSQVNVAEVKHNTDYQGSHELQSNAVMNAKFISEIDSDVNEARDDEDKKNIHHHSNDYGENISDEVSERSSTSSGSSPTRQLMKLSSLVQNLIRADDDDDDDDDITT